VIRIPECATVLGYAGKPQDAENAAKELERVGARPEVFWNIQSAFSRFIPRALLSSDFLARPANLSCFLGHYHIVKSALDRGLDALWVVEDDVKFLNDRVSVRIAIGAAPDDADFLILDGVPTERTRGRMGAATGWIRVEPGLDIRSAGNYILANRKAMKVYSRHLDGSLSGKLPLAADVGRDCRTLAGLNVYTAWPPLSVQRAAGGDLNKRASTSQSTWDRLLASYGVDPAAYGPGEKK